MVALEQLRSARGELDNLETSLYRPHRIEKHLAVLLADQGGELFLMLFDELAEPIQNARAPERRRRPPGGKGRDGRLDRRVNVDGIGKRHRTDRLAGCRIADNTVAGTVRGRVLSVDPQRHARDGHGGSS